MWLTDFLQSSEIAVKPENILISVSFFFTQQLILTHWIILSIILFNIWNKKSAF